MSKITVEELTELKNKIEKGKAKLSELNGEVKTHLENLKKDYDVKSIDEAKKKVEKMDKEIEELIEEIEGKETEIKEEFPQLFEG